MNMFRVNDIDESQAPLLDHLIELRTRLLRSVLALGVAPPARPAPHHEMLQHRPGS